jgi:hypothetical protein
MRQEPTPAVQQSPLGYWRCTVPGLPEIQRAWHVGRRQLRDRWQQADTLVTPLSERPLWCVAAGLLAGSLLGTAVDLPLVPLSGALLIAGLLLLLP